MDVTSLNNKKNTSAVSTSKDSPKSYTYLPPQEPDKFVKSDTEKTQDSGKAAKILAAGAIIGAAVTALVTKGKSSKLSKEVDNLKTTNASVEQELQTTKNRLQQEIRSFGEKSDMENQIETLTKEKKELLKNKELSDAKTKELQETLGQIPDDIIESTSKDAKVHYQTMHAATSKPLSYDPLKPPIEEISKERSSWVHYFDNKPLGPVADSRLHLPDFMPPSLSELKQKGNIDIQIPTLSSGSINAAVAPDASVIKVGADKLGKYEKTNIKLNYGNTVDWSEKKVARDLMQNFYDGHGHTLEGVRVQATYNPSTKSYKVRVSGKGEFNHEKIQDFGATSKSEDPRNAGGFGEGAKVMTARMINQFDVPEVKFASSNWQLTYQGDKGNLVSKLDKVDNPMRGNFVEFETTNEKLVESVLDSTNYFYHPQNPDFKNLTFENNDFAFKFFGLGQKKKGNFYMTQRFEYKNKDSWDDSVEDMILIFKRKPTEKGIIESNRDRTKITSEEITKLSGHFAATMDNKQLAGAISSLQEVWSPDNFKRIYGNQADPDKFASMLFLKGLLNEAAVRNVELNFAADSKFVAVNSWDRVSEDVLNDLRNQGYSICDGDLRKVGMDDIKTVMAKLRNHGALQPTAVESQKIQIIDEAAKAIVESMQVSGKKNIITPDEVTKPVYLFSRSKNDDTLAEAITKYERAEGKQYKGHWIARDYLNTGDFSDVLATRLHETCHKYGGDESAIFSYKLTDLIANYNEVMTSDPKLRTKLSTLKKLWNDITPKESK